MIIYLTKVILCSAVFIITYKLLLEKERMHRFNRFYLLTSLLLSFFIPAIQFTVAAPISPIVDYEILNIALLQDDVTTDIFPPKHSINYTFIIILAAYVTITLLFLLRFIANAAKMLARVRSHVCIPYKKASIVLINEDLTPHSFLNYLFLNYKDYKNGNIEQEILLHEYAHVQQKHSYDILLMGLLQAVFWFNPFVFIYRKAIQLNHEFLADEAVVHSCLNIASYQYLLIDKAGKKTTYHLASQFNYSITKKRLIMMTKTKSLRNALCRQMAIVPIVALSIFTFSSTSVAQETVTTPKITKLTVPSTKEGVSQELLNEFEQIVNKTVNDKGVPVYNKFSEADKNRLETIYLAMSKEQQEKQVVIFMAAPPPLPKAVPTQAQLDSWKNGKIYGVWINNKRVSNSELNKYQHSDFSQMFVSKLGKNTVNYGKHYYQVDLMTTEYYNDYYKKTIESNKRYLLGIRVNNKNLRIADKGKLVS